MLVLGLGFEFCTVADATSSAFHYYIPTVTFLYKKVTIQRCTCKYSSSDKCAMLCYKEHDYCTFFRYLSEFCPHHLKLKKRASHSVSSN